MSIGVEYVRNLCKERKISISNLEKSLGFANGYLNPKKLNKIPFERAVAISNYLHCDLENVLGVTDFNISAVASKLEKRRRLDPRPRPRGRRYPYKYGHRHNRSGTDNRRNGRFRRVFRPADTRRFDGAAHEGR